MGCRIQPTCTYPMNSLHLVTTRNKYIENERGTLLYNNKPILFWNCIDSFRRYKWIGTYLYISVWSYLRGNHGFFQAYHRQWCQIAIARFLGMLEYWVCFTIEYGLIGGTVHDIKNSQWGKAPSESPTLVNCTYTRSLLSIPQVKSGKTRHVFTDL